MWLVEGVTNSKSKTFLAFCFCFIGGVGVFSGWEFQKFWQYRLYVICFVLGFLLILFWHRARIRFWLLGLLFFILGGLRFLSMMPEHNSQNLLYYNGGNKIVSGRVVDEPDVRLDSVRYIIKTDLGKILVKLPLYPAYQNGDKFTLNCNLQTPKNFVDSNFRYDNYLARQGVFSICSVPKILTFESGYKHGLFFGLKTIISERVGQLWAEPQASLVAGLLYGARGGFPPELLDNFSRVGITHIIAISGYNISIIARVLMSLFIGVGLYRRQAFWVCVSGIILFVLFTGASASVMRAGIMGVIVLLAQQLGRLSHVGNILAVTAAIMLIVNPYILIWDAGFQLSFLATMGLVYLSPVVEKIIPNFIHPGAIREILVSTLSAIIITLPLILYQFGRLSLVAPIANVLVLWIVPWLMLFGFLSLALSFVFFPLAQVVAWITGVGLQYVITLASWLGNQTWSAVSWSISLLGLVICYFVLMGAVYKMRIDNKSRMR